MAAEGTLRCEACGGSGARTITAEYGRTSYFRPVTRSRDFCFPCIAHALVQTRPDEAAEMCNFIGIFLFGEKHPMASYKEIESLMKDVTPDLLVSIPKGGKLKPEQLGDATYRHLQLKLMSEIAKSLDSIAYNANQSRGLHEKLLGVLSKLEGHYGEMVKMQKQRNGGPRQNEAATAQTKP